MIPNQSFDMWYLAHGRDPHRVKSVLSRLRDAYEAGAASAPAAKAAWQPMDTAPRDGSAILVKSDRGICIVSWRGIHSYETVKKVWCVAGTGRNRDSSDAEWYDTCVPVGWMPLPSP